MRTLGTLIVLQGTESPSFAPLLIVTALAAFIQLVTDRLNALPVPVIVGEILVAPQRDNPFHHHHDAIVT